MLGLVILGREIIGRVIEGLKRVVVSDVVEIVLTPSLAEDVVAGLVEVEEIVCTLFVVVDGKTEKSSKSTKSKTSLKKLKVSLFSVSDVDLDGVIIVV